MRYVEATTNYEPRWGEVAVFLAGGITGCPDWQQEMVSLLAESDLILLNPRRKHFPIGDPNAALEQITWEHDHLWKADAILFWFPCETICPIVLYELGAWSWGTKLIFVGVHPDYQRRQDVEIQTALARPGKKLPSPDSVSLGQKKNWPITGYQPAVEIVYSLEELAAQVAGFDWLTEEGP